MIQNQIINDKKVLFAFIQVPQLQEAFGVPNPFPKQGQRRQLGKHMEI